MILNVPMQSGQCSFYRWLAEITWSETPTDQVLFDFALAKGIV